jgi:NAD(P)H-nitrite reductase large subunit
MNQPDDLIICRCEEISLGEIRKAIREGARDPDAVKRMTRAGMGLCQSKTCCNLIARLIHEQTGIPLREMEPFTTRPPVRPVPVKAWSAAKTKIES